MQRASGLAHYSILHLTSWWLLWLSLLCVFWFLLLLATLWLRHSQWWGDFHIKVMVDALYLLGVTIRGLVPLRVLKSKITSQRFMGDIPVGW